MYGLVQNGVVIAVNKVGFTETVLAVYSEPELISPEETDESGEVTKKAVYSEPELISPEETVQLAEGEIIEAEAIECGQTWDGQNLGPVVKTQDQINIESRKYLTETDWYIIRKVETGEPVPEEVITKRQAAREAVK